MASPYAPNGGIIENHPEDEPIENEVVKARARRSAGSKDPNDVLMDRFGTGKEMGLTAIPVEAGYEAVKPILRNSRTANWLFGKVFGKEQMVGPNTQAAGPKQIVENLGATTLGAYGLDRLMRMWRRRGMIKN